MFCPRSIHLWWREIWLERVSIGAYPQATPAAMGQGKSDPAPGTMPPAVSPVTPAYNKAERRAALHQTAQN
jgi:hypothetical protein